MAYGVNRSLSIPGLVAGEDLSSSQYYFVKMASTAGQVVAINGTTDNMLGILQNTPADNAVAEVFNLGASKLVAGSTAVTAGDLVGWNAEGQGNTRSTATSRFGALAIEASAADGSLITVSLIGHSSV